MSQSKKKLRGEKELLIIFLKDISVEWCSWLLFQGLKKRVVKSEIQTALLRLLPVKGWRPYSCLK